MYVYELKVWKYPETSETYGDSSGTSACMQEVVSKTPVIRNCREWSEEKSCKGHLRILTTR